MLFNHFSKWRTAHFSDETFYSDGIINEEIYDQTPQKILFIAKEPNASNHKKGNFSGFCDEWNNDRPEYGFAMRIAEWAYGILNNFPIFSDLTVDMRYEYLKKIAFINCKKSGGGGTAGAVQEFNQLVTDQLDRIHYEIEIIKPEIVILCLSHSQYLRQLLFPHSTDWINSGYDVKIAKANNVKLIDFYHPSSRNVAPAAYSLLQNVMQSDKFQML